MHSMSRGSCLERGKSIFRGANRRGIGGELFISYGGSLTGVVAFSFSSC